VRSSGVGLPALLLASSIFWSLAAGVVAPAAAQAPDTTRAAPSPGSGAADDEPYHLSADRLEGTAGAGDNVYTARRAVVVHGRTTVTGDSALIYRTRELVLFRGNVRIVDGSTRMRGDEASYDRKARLAILRGNVRIEEGGARITGHEAQFYRDENRSVVIGNPRLEDSTRTLTADRIEYDRNSDIVTATGDVDAFDRAESTRVRASRVRYDRRRNYAWAEIEPVLTLTERGGKVTEVRGKELEFDNAAKRVFATGDVRIHREDLEASCGRAEFYRAEDTALLLENPKAWDQRGVVRGDSIRVRFSGDRIQSLIIRPNGVVEYAALSDSLVRGERNVAKGDQIEVFFDGEQAREAFLTGHAESRYWPSSADSAQGGRNVSNGDTIRVYFDNGKPSRATVRGGSKGTYYLAAEGDTSAAAAREFVRYQGTEIAYDVAQGTVDVVGEADVSYREMNLKAKHVRFDSRTDKMRAEGDPVLNDGKDTIDGNTMTYDLGRRKGTVTEGRTVYERGYISGERVARVSERELDVAHGTYSTCDLREPHYHFESRKMKVLIQDKVVARPVVFYVKNVPVMALPFYIFPIKSGRHSGFQLPQLEFGSSTGGGKFVRNVGYYWAISDYTDASAWVDYYQQQSWVTHGQFRYHKRYGYQGQLGASYENRFQTGSNRWDFVGRHYQTLGPGFALTGQANLTNSSDYRRDPDLGNNVLVRIQRNLRSNLSLQKNWSGGAFNLGLLQNEDLDAPPGGLGTQQQLPSVTLSLNSRPLGHPARGQDPAKLSWLSTTLISFRATGLYERKDYEPFTQVTRDSLGVPIDSTVVDSLDARGATRWDLGLTDVRTLLGFIRVSPGFNYSGVYYSRDQAGDEHQIGGVWNARLGVNTAVFGTFRTGLGPLRAIRHVVTPGVSIVYQPANSNLLYKDASGVTRSRFDGVSGITLGGGESKFLAYSLQQDLHVKWGSAANPTVVNNLIQMRMDGSYNLLAARSGAKPLSDLRTSLRLKPIQRSDFDFGFVHNLYDGRLLSFSASTGILLQGESEAVEEADRALLEEPGAQAGRELTVLSPRGLTPGGLPWSVGASVSYGGSRSKISTGGYTPWTSNARLNGSLGLNISKNWRFDYAWQYDVTGGLMVSQFFTVKRELHCWEMQFTRSISGDVGNEYYFKINVKNLPEVYFEQGSRGLRGFGGLNSIY
jgi:lipopolysaccharide assembly outer membrane protein LptD (OstA)